MISLSVLRLVNSANYGLSRKIGAIHEAVHLLGINELRTLVITCGMVNSIPKVEGINLTLFWEDSFSTSVYAKLLATNCNADADLAYTAGLISRLGNILIHMGAPSAANEIDSHVKSGHHGRRNVEIKRLGFTSEDVCAELGRRWHFSDELIDGIAQCGAPLEYEEPNKLACIVFIARYLSECHQDGKSRELILEKFPWDVVEKLNVPEQHMKQLVDKLLSLDIKMITLV